MQPKAPPPAARTTRSAASTSASPGPAPAVPGTPASFVRDPSFRPVRVSLNPSAPFKLPLSTKADKQPKMFVFTLPSLQHVKRHISLVGTATTNPVRIEAKWSRLPMEAVVGEDFPFLLLYAFDGREQPYSRLGSTRISIGTSHAELVGGKLGQFSATIVEVDGVQCAC